MTRRAGMLLLNIIIAVMLAVTTSCVALFAFCQYFPGNFCRQSYAYPTVAGITAALSLTTFLLHQHANTHAMMRPKRKAVPHISGRYQLLEKSAVALWRIWNLDDAIVKTIPLGDMEDMGWVIEFNEAYPVIISQREYYYWLLDVVKLQRQLEMSGKKNVSSPLSARNNPGLSGKRLIAYMSMLETLNAIEYLNANVKRIKPAFAEDVWMKIIKPLEAIKPIVHI